ncbi:hypothetical protein MRX96_017857 [Rhipicephalus microplus]
MQREGLAVWWYVWSLTSIACITLLVPITIWLLPYFVERTSLHCTAGSCHSNPSFPTAESWPVSVEPVEHFELPNGISQYEFCARQVEPDPRTPPQSLPTTPMFHLKKKSIVNRHLLCHFDTQ